MAAMRALIESSCDSRIARGCAASGNVSTGIGGVWASSDLKWNWPTTFGGINLRKWEVETPIALISRRDGCH